MTMSKKEASRLLKEYKKHNREIRLAEQEEARKKKEKEEKSIVNKVKRWWNNGN